MAVLNTRLPTIWHGGDYNPEQWPPATWDEDMRLMQASHFRVATVGVFAWAALQPAEDRFTFDWLDTAVDKLARADRYLCLATPSMAQPAWLSRTYPDVLRADPDGRRRHHGRRQNYCPSSPNYRRLASGLARRLAQRYGHHPRLIAWHVSNEYGGACFCDTCALAFRDWLRQRYTSLDDLNQRWWTAFWSHTYTDWDQVDPPYANGESLCAGLTVDYRRFQSDAMLDCFKLERDAIREFATDIPITTNMMGAYEYLDYRAWAPELDVISWDCYPWPSADPGDIAFLHDLNRGLKDGQPFMLMEQTPSSQNWQPYNALKRPGVLRLWSYLAVAHGADTVMYFQWRRGRGGTEMFHGAVVEHGRDPSARVFNEVAALGAELERVGPSIIDSRTRARVAVLFDWNNWWAIDSAVGPTQHKDYVPTVRRWYRALWRRNVAVDIVFSDSDLSQYDVIVAPTLYMVKSGLSDRLRALLERGGTFVATAFSGVVDDSTLAFEGYPGPLRPLLGLWVEEIDALYPDQTNEIVMADHGGTFSCRRWCEIVRPEGAEILATYGQDFYAGSAVVTRHQIGRGTAYYVATDPDDAFLDSFAERVLSHHDIRPPLQTPPGVEIAVRHRDGQPITFVLNHTTAPVEIALPPATRYHDLLSQGDVEGALQLRPRDVAILTPRPHV